VGRLESLVEKMMREKRTTDPQGYQLLKILWLSLQHSPIWEFLRKKDGEYLYVSPAVEAITGYNPQEFYDDPDTVMRIVHPDYRDLWENHQHRQMNRGEKVFIDFKIVTKGGEVRWIFHFCERIRDTKDGLDLIRSTNVDISRIKVKELLEKKRANTDPLTGLFNRRFLEEQAPKELWSDMGWGYNHVAMGDIDDFKLINDTYGHQAGDTVLRKVAEVIRQNLRGGDIAVRWGGEEFLVLLHDMNDQTAYEVVDRLRSKIEAASIHHMNSKLQVTMSFGVARCIGRGYFSEAVKEADERLYLAKKSGKNRVIAEVACAR